ncbi:MAG: hypothetical protein KW788_02670 [Candidatus Doudnabacteria bacterium]|nr:hypothetical protein [Candidatus Doudnabacteria bacterium]
MSPTLAKEVEVVEREAAELLKTPYNKELVLKLAQWRRKHELLWNREGLPKSAHLRLAAIEAKVSNHFQISA